MRQVMIWLLAICLLYTNVAEANLSGEWTYELVAITQGGRVSNLGEAGLNLRFKVGSYPWQVHGSAMLKGTGNLDSWKTSAEVDRLYLKFYFPRADVRVGKQHMKWGMGYAWSPTDLFNPPQPQDPGRERPGVDSIVVMVPVGPLDYWSFGLTYSDDLRYSIRRHGNLSGRDWSLLVISDIHGVTLGACAKGDLIVGWHGDMAFSLPKGAGSPGWEMVIGGDYSWLDGRLLWLGEYFYNSEGATDEADYDYQSWLMGEERYLARHYLFNQLNYSLSDFSSLSASAVVNLVDMSSVWTFGAHTLLNHGWKFSFTASLAGGREGEFSAGPYRPDATFRTAWQYPF
jgi:hypothetical protein